MDTTGEGLSNNAKEIIKEFVIKKMISYLVDPDCVEKIKEDKEIFRKLGIRLEPKDICALIVAVRESDLIDHENRQIKNGQGMRNHFAILVDFLNETNLLTYYNKFSQVKLDQFNLSDFQYVMIALKIFDYTNWTDDSLNVETQAEVRDYYLNTILHTALKGEDKVYNLNVLQNDLKIALSEEEMAEVSKHLKQDIMKLVDLIDQMRKTSFGAKPLPAGGKFDSYQTAKEETAPVAEEGKPSEVGSKEKKKHRKLFGRK
jgi:hypothetical protein